MTLFHSGKCTNNIHIFIDNTVPLQHDTIVNKRNKDMYHPVKPFQFQVYHKKW